MESESNKRRFVGLRWKSFIWLSLLLLSLGTAFYVLNYHALKSQFDDRRQAEKLSLRLHTEGLFIGASDRLVRLGGALASMSDLGLALKERDTNRIASLITDFARLGYELDLRRIDLFTADAAPIDRWSQSDAEQLPAGLYRRSIDKVRVEQRPAVLLNCQALCLLYAFTPVLAAGNDVGVIALGQSIADFVIEFKMVTGADIALAVPTESNDNSVLAGWGAKIPALTDASTMMPLLQHIAEYYPDASRLDQGRIIKWNNAYYDVYRIPLDTIIPGQAGFVLLMSDVSRRMNNIEHTLQQGLLTTGGSLVAAELALFYLIHMPLRRLKQLSLTLPLLAEGAFEQARQYFSGQRKNARFRDEIDFLYDSATQLSHQLEQNRLTLNSKNRELAEERDFIRELLEIAQVLVVTQTKQGIIRVGNEFASQLIGYPADQWHGRCFVDLIADRNVREDILNQLRVLCDTGQRRLEHELDLICKNGELRKVVWVHTPLREEHTDGTAVLSVGLDITERVQAESSMRWLANHDPLTALVNRHRFFEELADNYQLATQTGESSALLVFDLDHFKDVNDTSGHAAGDALLQMVADELKNRARTADIVARLGGDEFAMLLPATDQYGAETFAKQLADRLSRKPFIYQEKRYRVGASIGIALLPQHGADIQEVMANADLAMFDAKRAGRSQVRFFSYALQHSETLNKNVYWKDILIQAMENDFLFFCFQPITDAKTGQTIFYEALLRLKMSDGKIAMPAEFLPSAERAGLNYELDCHVVDMALNTLLRDPSKRISVNLSTAALDQSGWCEPLADAVHYHCLDADRLIFEITETAVIKDMDKAKQIVRKVKALGFRFAVDDFGSGFSSLYYLKHLPVDFVKLDQSLIKGIVNETEDIDFIRAIVSMVHGYGKKVVAEGIEDTATLNLLKTMHVDLVQGNFIGVPAPSTDQNFSRINFKSMN